MRQAGILAAGGLHALRNHIDRLQEDHDKAFRVAQVLEKLPAFKLAESPQTNIIILASDTDVPSLKNHLMSKGIRISGTRWVFHLDVSEEDVEHLLTACRSYHPEKG